MELLYKKKKKSGVVNIFLPSCPQFFSLLNIKFMGISESHKSIPIQK